MSEIPKNDLERLDDLRESLEELRARIMDLDAMAHAAAETLQHIPFLPRPPRTPESSDKPAWTEEERRNLGRMQTLVFATAEAAERALDDINELIDQTYSDRGPSGCGSSGASGGDGTTPGGPNGSSGPNGSNGGQPSPSRTGAPAGAHEQPRDPGLRSMPGGIIVDMRPLPPHL